MRLRANEPITREARREIRERSICAAAPETGVCIEPLNGT
jgi:hypothetical protein